MADERRLSNRMIAKWSTVSRGNRLPRYDDLDVNIFGNDLPYCVTAELAAEIGDSELIYVGKALRNKDWTQGCRQIVSDYPANSLLCLTAAKIAAAVAKRSPLIFGGTGVCDVSAILYRAILLPMSDDGKTISHVVGAINFREITAVEEYSDIAVAPPLVEELTPAERLVAFASRRMVFAADTKKAV